MPSNSYKIYKHTAEPKFWVIGDHFNPIEKDLESYTLIGEGTDLEAIKIFIATVTTTNPTANIATLKRQYDRFKEVEVIIYP